MFSCLPHPCVLFFVFVFEFVHVFVDACSADFVCPHWHQVKVMTENELLGYACEQFLGKSVIEIKSVILQTLEGHLRAILGGSSFKTMLSLLDLFSFFYQEMWAAHEVFKSL